MNETRIVVVGAGLAGLRSAERLRELGFDGEVVIVGAEDTMPYHRPALSKQFISGALTESDLVIPPLDDLDVVWRLGTPVTGLDLDKRELELPGAEALSFDGLVIATGVEARRQNGGQHGHPRVVTVRTVADSRRIKRNMAGNKLPVAVIGTGFTGCEIASTLTQMGRRVHLLGRSRNLMGKALGPELAEVMTNLHVDHGVDLVTGASVQQWRLNPESVDLLMSDGTVLETCCTVVATGTVPVTNWLRGSGVQVDDGVVCEATTHVVGTEDVVAAGDVAQWPNLMFGTAPRRTEHWTNAIEMGRAAAENLLAGREFSRPFTPLPRFWSEQHAVRIQAAGVPALGKERRRLAGWGTRSLTGYYIGERMVGVVGLNQSSGVLQHEAEIVAGAPPLVRVPVADEFEAVGGGHAVARSGGQGF